jgi:hypothetical protein
MQIPPKRHPEVVFPQGAKYTSVNTNNATYFTNRCQVNAKAKHENTSKPNNVLYDFIMC